MDLSDPQDLLLVQCCQALADRQRNYGGWKNGIPACIHEYKLLHFPMLDYDEAWFPVVEIHVHFAAIMLIDRIAAKGGAA